MKLKNKKKRKNMIYFDKFCKHLDVLKKLEECECYFKYLPRDLKKMVCNFMELCGNNESLIFVLKNIIKKDCISIDKIIRLSFLYKLDCNPNDFLQILIEWYNQIMGSQDEVAKDKLIIYNDILFLLEKGADPNLMEREYIKTSRDNTIIPLLLKYNLDVFKVDNFGNTYLHNVTCIYPECTYNNRIDSMYSILNHVKYTNNSDIIKNYINQQNIDGKTALHLCMEMIRCSSIKENANFIFELVKNGANVNALDNDFNTPLHYIVLSKKYRLYFAELLIKYGANVNMINKNSQTPLSLVLSSTDSPYAEPTKEKTISLLISHGAKKLY